MATLVEILAKLAQQEQGAQRIQTGGDNAIFAHWNIP